MLIESKIYNSKTAYTLIELSIVISIIAILLTGAIGISVSLINVSKKDITINKIDTLYGAIGKFIMIYKRLPCPASLNLLSSDPQFGIERVSASGGCQSSPSNGVYANDNIYYGMLPVKSLGLSLEMSQDEFGGKYSYIIDHRFANQYLEVPDFTKSSFGTIENLTSINVSERILSANLRVVTDQAILLIISHGQNKFGAFNYNSLIQNTNSLDSDEVSNSIASGVFDNIFIVNSFNNQTFDDIVFYKTRNQIVDDHGLYNIIACKQDSTFTNPIYYGHTTYLQQCSTTYKRIPEAYCDKLGRLVIMNKCP